MKASQHDSVDESQLRLKMHGFIANRFYSQQTFKEAEREYELVLYGGS